MPNALVDGQRAAQRARQRDGVALDDEVELARLAAEPDVAHEAADDGDALERRARAAGSARARRAPRAGRCAARAISCRTAIPAAARCAFASAIV